MKISYNWLQTHIQKKLPDPEEVAKRITFGFAEIESLEKIKIGGSSDWIFDVKILPDRACYALSHRGVAGEISALLGFKNKNKEINVPKTSRRAKNISVCVSEKSLCPRYTARVIENVSVAQSPKWLRERLESIGERSINNIVDATNFVMFDMGQPLHAFDADKVNGGIEVRKARASERIVTLDGKELLLDENALVIADDTDPLALAGVKGGKRAEVTNQTKSIILEAASFSAPFIRQTSQRFGIKTESSRRFENNLSPHCAEEGSFACAELISELSPKAQFGKLVDVFPKKIKPKSISFPISFICDSLGLEISEKKISETLGLLGISVKKRGKIILVIPPFERLDLTRAEDFAEEVGRIVGYERIPEAELPNWTPSWTPSVSEHSVSKEDAIRDFLVAEGFSEVMTSSFTALGDIAIEKPLAEDKKFLRNDLWFNFEISLIQNTRNMPLFGVTEIKQFEIGKVFGVKGEHLSLAVGYVGNKMSKVALNNTITKLEKYLKVNLGGRLVGGQNVYECAI
jgi:phenylalanyl-tRNA synthetase beta chain